MMLLPFLAIQLAFAQPAVEAVRAPIEWKSPVAAKNFYLLSLLEDTPAWRGALAKEQALSAIAVAKKSALHQECTVAIPSCYANALRWSDAEIDTVAKTLRSMPLPDLDARLRASGAYQRHHGLSTGGPSSSELIAAAWKECARGINHVMDVYALGQPPRYPAIDSPGFDVKSERYGRLVRVAVSVMQEESDSYDLFFHVPLRFAVHLLEANWRDEAGRFEPMHLGENAAAYAAIATTRWDRYPYTAIVVPGSGSDRPGVAMSPWGKLRTQLAARRFRDGKAPFLIVSGGFVHPAHTPYCEALEMKRALMRDYGIPPSAILIDPHARHTTTNLRNAARILYRYGFPCERVALIVTDLDQSRYIESKVFADRCAKELGYQPHTLGRRLSPSDIEFLPRIESLHIDPMDPLDP
jgi:hypothetical protein